MRTLAPSRIAVVDLLRAFALFGIILTHAEMSFHAAPEPTADFMTFHPLDTLVSRAVDLLTESKFYTIFSFLFGLSFAIQLDNATQKGTGFAARFAWRLSILFVIGMVHQLIFNGDILMIYAALGLLLIPLGKMPTRILLVGGLLLLLNIPGLLVGIERVAGPPPTTAEQAEATASSQRFMEGARLQYEANKSGSATELAKVNFTIGLAMKTQYQLTSGRFWITFGCFLLGMCAWRANFFRDSPANRKFFQRLLVCGGALTILSTVTTYAYPGSPGADSISGVLGYFASGVQDASLAATYVALITLLFWSHPHSWLIHMTCLGKMGLSVYLLQSVFGAALFYGIGLGLLGELGSASAAALGTAFFVAQVFLARWWSKRFAMGPVEWLWRSLTYLKVQPNKAIAYGPAGQ